MYYGIDPDMRSIAIAVLPAVGLPVAVRIVKADGTRTGAAGALGRALQEMFAEFPPTVLVAEGQDLSYTGKSNRARANDVAALGVVSGAALALGSLAGAKTHNPMPAAWKGHLPKLQHQARVFSELGIPFLPSCDESRAALGGKVKGYCYPTSPLFGLKKSEWADGADALGLALWGRSGSA